MNYQIQMPTREEIEQAMLSAMYVIGTVIILRAVRSILHTAGEHNQNRQIRLLKKRVEALEAGSICSES